MHDKVQKQLKIKVCGMKEPQNIQELLKLEPDYMGYIFYPKSARFIGDVVPENIKLPTRTKLTGVFVDASLEYITKNAVEYTLQAIQLHGKESPDFCREVQKLNVVTIKAFGISEDFDWVSLEHYSDSVDAFLFDTKTSAHGGSGRKFNWDLLKRYQLQIPYFISGGIGPEDMDTLINFQDQRLIAVDLNSKYETMPGEKNISLLHTTFKKIRN